MTTREHDVRLADGRTLRIQDSGAIEAPTVVFCHGTPGSRLLHDRWLAAAADAGLRLLAYDRPGCGGSTAQPDRSVADAAADVAALADQLQLERFAVWGSPAAAPMPWPVRPCWPTGWWRPRSSRRRRRRRSRIGLVRWHGGQECPAPQAGAGRPGRDATGAGPVGPGVGRGRFGQLRRRSLGTGRWPDTPGGRWAIVPDRRPRRRRWRPGPPASQGRCTARRRGCAAAARPGACRPR